MDNMTPIWIFLFWTVGAPVLWLLIDYLQTQKATRAFSERPLPLRAAMRHSD